MAFLLFCALLAASGSMYASQAASDFSRPVTAAEYQGYLGQGFNANYFKRKGGPLPKYNPQNIQILKDLGFRNLRIRCVASLYEDYHTELFRNEFLANLTKVVDDCIDNGIAPIVTFRHREAENYATEEDLQNYLDWWRIVAEELKDKSYLLSFNLFTEMGLEVCRNERPVCKDDVRIVSAIIILLTRALQEHISRALHIFYPLPHAWHHDIIMTLHLRFEE